MGHVPNLSLFLSLYFVVLPEHKKQEIRLPPAPKSFPPKAPSFIPSSYNRSIEEVDIFEPVCFFNFHVVSNNFPKSSIFLFLFTNTCSPLHLPNHTFLKRYSDLLFCSHIINCLYFSEENRVKPVKITTNYFLIVSSFPVKSQLAFTSYSFPEKSIRFKPPNDAAI